MWRLQDSCSRARARAHTITRRGAAAASLEFHRRCWLVRSLASSRRCRRRRRRFRARSSRTQRPPLDVSAHVYHVAASTVARYLRALSDYSACRRSLNQLLAYAKIDGAFWHFAAMSLFLRVFALFEKTPSFMHFYDVYVER